MANVAELVVKVVTDTSQAKGLDETAAKGSKFSRGLATASKVAAGALVAVGGAAISAAKAAAEDAASQDALAQSMMKNAGASKSQIAATEDWISKMSMATGVADDELRPALSTLVRATGDVEQSQKALAVAMDVSAATGKPLKSVTDAMAKGFAGSTTSLGRLVPGLSKAALASGDMGRVMDELKDKTGGAAKAAGETAAGKMQRFTLALDETQEAAGAALLPALMKLTDILIPLGNWAQSHGTMFTVIAAGVAILAAAIIALNLALKIYNTIAAVTAVVSKAAWLSTLGPILLVVAAIAAVIVIVVLLWKKSETFRRIVLGVWAAIKKAASATAGVIRAVFNVAFAALTIYVRAYLTIFKVAFTVVRAVVKVAADVVKSIWRAVWSAVSGYVRVYASVIREVFSAIRSAASTAADWIGDRWRTLWDALKSAASGVASVLSKPFNAVKSAIDSVISAVQSLISWLGKIHVPKISLPHIPGLSRVASSVARAGVSPVSRYAAPSMTGFGAGAAAVPLSAVGAGPTIVIEGALDPEAVARQIDRIMHNHTRRIGRVTHP